MTGKGCRSNVRGFHGLRHRCVFPYIWVRIPAGLAGSLNGIGKVGSDADLDSQPYRDCLSDSTVGTVAPIGGRSFYFRLVFPTH